MPFESKSHARKFGAMYSRGEISKATLRKWWAHTKRSYAQLPERKGEKPKAKYKKKKRAKYRAKRKGKRRLRSRR